METKKQVIVYVDGYNFYYGLRKGGPKWKRLYWLDVVKFFERMMQPDQELVEVNYYSARPLDDQQATAHIRNKFICDQADRLVFVGVTESSSLYPLSQTYHERTVPL